MFGKIASLFIGSDKWLYIALVVLGVSLAGVTWLSISLYADKAVLHVEVKKAQKELKELKEKHDKEAKEAEGKLEKLQKEKEALQDTLSRVEALSDKLKAEAKERQKRYTKKQKELQKEYEERLKHFEEGVKDVQDSSESDSSIIDAAGI